MIPIISWLLGLAKSTTRGPSKPLSPGPGVAKPAAERLREFQINHKPNGTVWFYFTKEGECVPETKLIPNAWIYRCYSINRRNAERKFDKWKNLQPMAAE